VEAKREATLLQQLERAKQCYGAGCAADCERLLGKLRGLHYPDVDALVQAHDNLLFLRAFPQSETVAKLCDSLLAGMQPPVERFADSSVGASVLDDERVSGIIGTTLENSWTFELARWLGQRHSGQISTEWNVEEHYRQMATVLPNCLPLLDDDSFVEADTPYLKWVETAAGGHERDLQWLCRSFDALPVTPLVRTSLYDSLGVNLRWSLGDSPASRTLARRPVSRMFVHREPLLQRRQVSLHDEMASAPRNLQKLGRDEAQAVIDMARDALAVRYRELQGSTCADPGHAFQVDAGRGVQLFLWGLDAEWRLPLRAYYAGFTLKNGVPVNYFEAIGLFEWIEVGFNTFYAFREGETAWIYSKILHTLHQLAGVTCFSVYPYQIGQDNEEAIQSGALWFYRKLGFRPGRPDLMAITEREERRMAHDPQHRTSARILRKLAEGHMFFEVRDTPVGCWDYFSTRNLGLAVQQKMAQEFGGDAVRMRRRALSRLCKALGVNPDAWTTREQWALSNFAVALALVENVARWSATEKKLLVAVVRAKAGRDETQYLHLLQKHSKLRDAFLRAGSVAECGNAG
jgi:hypothetical protein